MKTTSIFILLAIFIISCGKKSVDSEQLAKQSAEQVISDCGYYALIVDPELADSSYQAIKTYMQSVRFTSRDIDKALFFQKSFSNTPAIYLRSVKKVEWQTTVLCNPDSLDTELCQYVINASNELLKLLMPIAEFDSIQFGCTVADIN